jgi:hypothetical protein
MAERDAPSTVHKTDRELLEEIAGRSRRIETKTTMVADKVGLSFGEKPVYDKAKRILWVKTAKISIEDVLDALGAEIDVVQVRCGETFLGTVCRG